MPVKVLQGTTDSNLMNNCFFVFNTAKLFPFRKSYWRLDFEVKVNGTVVKPVSVAPLNHTSVSSAVHVAGIHGNYSISREVSHSTHLIPWSYYGWLYTREWISSSQYEIFRQHLIQYYKRMYAGKLFDTELILFVYVLEFSLTFSILVMTSAHLCPAKQFITIY